MNSFLSQNGIQNEYINDKMMAMYELKRYGNLTIEINKTLSELMEIQQKHRSRNLGKVILISGVIVSSLYVGFKLISRIKLRN